MFFKKPILKNKYYKQFIGKIYRGHKYDYEGKFYRLAKLFNCGYVYENKLNCFIGRNIFDYNDINFIKFDDFDISNIVQDGTYIVEPGGVASNIFYPKEKNISEITLNYIQNAHTDYERDKIKSRVRQYPEHFEWKLNPNAILGDYELHDIYRMRLIGYKNEKYDKNDKGFEVEILNGKPYYKYVYGDFEKITWKEFIRYDFSKNYKRNIEIEHLKFDVEMEQKYREMKEKDNMRNFLIEWAEKHIEDV